MRGNALSRKAEKPAYESHWLRDGTEIARDAGVAFMVDNVNIWGLCRPTERRSSVNIHSNNRWGKKSYQVQHSGLGIHARGRSTYGSARNADVISDRLWGKPWKKNCKWAKVEFPTAYWLSDSRYGGSKLVDQEVYQCIYLYPTSTKPWSLGKVGPLHLRYLFSQEQVKAG